MCGYKNKFMAAFSFTVELFYTKTIFFQFNPTCNQEKLYSLNFEFMKRTTFIILSTFLFFSCNKPKNDCTVTTQSISGSYKITAATYKANAGAAEIDNFNILFPDPCQRDDVYTFNAAGTYQIADVGMICTTPGNDNGTWSVTGPTVIVIDGEPVTIESFDCNKLILVNTDTQTTGDRLKLTLTKQ